MDRREDFPNYPKDGDDEFADVIAPYDLWHIAVYADCGGTALWDMNGEMLGCAEYGPFESLDDRFSAWSKKCEGIHDRQFVTGAFKEDAVPKEEMEAAYQEGLQLCAELAETLRGKCLTIDYFYRGGPDKRFFVPDPPEYPPKDKLA